MSRVGIDDNENLESVRATAEGRSTLIATQTECTFAFTTEAGWPAGVVMSYLFTRDRFWLTAAAGRAHVRGAVRDPRVTLVISNAGTTLPGRQMLSVRGTATVHSGEAVKSWFYPEFSRHLAPGDPDAFATLLDSPQRVVIEVETVRVAVSHDSTQMPGDGRGGYQSR
ncbi:pyridoxamine 5'-phosphate oxidase family protein [Rhodococcus sp. ARC_M12]|uniref:pyridoxamine 5'-phosphate oxidase family protein n=1 Tax=Rhodococcus sp. ARC_M12 TaxID=2928854 RepID=UPI001FB3D228|nr:pyridoxamine 5'-phosphate oxidase family protein [Rhodococcus sp. ARC_M12]MCJ0977776.1 pyridoxamine 5'-phosphate oxidase family protein [Rhodococcus sp. ARC_M12]